MDSACRLHRRPRLKPSKSSQVLPWATGPAQPARPRLCPLGQPCPVWSPHTSAPLRPCHGDAPLHTAPGLRAPLRPLAQSTVLHRNSLPGPGSPALATAWDAVGAGGTPSLTGYCRTRRHQQPPRRRPISPHDGLSLSPARAAALGSRHLLGEALQIRPSPVLWHTSRASPSSTYHRRPRTIPCKSLFLSPCLGPCCVPRAQDTRPSNKRLGW